MARVTGSIIRQGKNRDILYMKARDRQGQQIKRRLGPASEWSRKAAEDALREFLTDLGREPARAANSVTVQDAADAWLYYVEHDQARAASTVADYRNAARRYIVGNLGADRPIRDVDVDAVEELRSLLLGQVSRRTAQKALVLLHGMLSYAKSRRWIDSNPAAEARKVQPKRSTDFAVLAPAEVVAVASKASDDQVAAAITVAAFTGLRLGELRGLRWRDVDFANALVHVRRSYWRSQESTPKSGKARSVPLIDQAARALDGLSRRERFTAPDDYVLCSVTGDRLHDAVLRDGVYEAMSAAGISRDRGTGTPFRWHDLRHSFGTLAVPAFPLSDVQAFMGHAHIQTTMVYVHHVPQHDAARRLSALVAGSASAGEPFEHRHNPIDLITGVSERRGPERR